MAAYLIADITVRDAEGFERYRQAVPPLIAAAGGRYIVRGGRTETLEGEFGLHRVVILEFPSMEAARGFYDSAAYAPLLALRLATTESRAVLVEGYAPPDGPA